MNYSEINKDLFTVDSKYHLAHCISADAKMGAGIAVQFKKRFNLASLYQMNLAIGQAIHVERVFNLITKQNYWEKPTYDSLRRTLINMRNHAVEQNITHIAMPTIGAGLDRLSWDKNRIIIQDVFRRTDISIVVCFK